MELVYSVEKCAKYRRDWMKDERPTCCLSSRNVIALCTTAALADSDTAADTGDLQRKRDTDRISVSGLSTLPDAVADVAVDKRDDKSQEKYENSLLQINYYVYVCDIDKPWEVFLVTTHKEKVCQLKWHISGSQLILFTTYGKCQLWQMKDHILNHWVCATETSIPGEEVLALSWLHSGFQMTFNGDKKESPIYTDKITHTPFKATLSHFGGAPTEGWVAVTASGMICFGLVRDGSQMMIKYDSLNPCRSRVTAVDISHEKSGDLLVVTSNGMITSAIQCYRVSVRPEKTSCSITCKPLAGFYAKCHMDPILTESPTSRISHVQFMPGDSGDALIIGAGDVNNSHVELWYLTREVLRLHQMYVSSVPPDTTYHTFRWLHQSSITHGSMPVSVAVPRFPIVYTEGVAMLFQYVAIAYQDGSVKLVNKGNFQPMATTNLDIGISENEKNEKRRKVVPYITSMQQTLTGCGLVGIDQYSYVYVMKMVNTRDPVTQVPPVYLVGLLEYAITTGYDCWDILAALKPEMIQGVMQKFSDNFSKQPAACQELLYSSFMAVKASLLRISRGGHQRAADSHCKLLLHCLATLFKSILRPKTLSAQEKSPAEKLTLTCSSNSETDIDKVRMTLNPEKDYVVDAATLQSMQPLIQWVADLTLYLLAAVPMAQGYIAFAGCTLLRDAPVLASLRELLLLIRVWGIINPHCLPHFTTTASNFDSVAQLFKLLSKITRKEGYGGEFDADLIDECCLLQSQLRVPSVDQGFFGNTRYGSAILSQSHPVKYTFGETPNHVTKGTSELLLPDGQVASAQQKDVVRQVRLGVSPSGKVKRCLRCDCVSLLKGTQLSAVMNAWDLRWVKTCLCGGHWKLAKS